MQKGLKRNLFTLISGSLLAQIIVVLSSPFMTRLFNVDDIGIYTLFISFASTFTSVMNIRFDMGIVSVDDSEVKPLIKGSIMIGIATTILTTIIYIVYSFFLAPDLSRHMILVPLFFVLMLAYSLNNVFTSYNNRMEEYSTISAVYVIRNVIQNCFPLVVCCLFSSSYLLLVGFYVIGQLAGLSYQGRKIIADRAEINAIPLERVFNTLKHQYRYALFSAPASIANSFSYSSITMALEAFFSASVIGYYSVSTRVLGLPITLFAGNLSKVFFQEAADEYRVNGGYQRTLKKVSVALVPLSVIAFICMWFFAKPACVLFFGSEWSIAGDYIRILSPMFALRLLCTSLMPGLLVANKQNVELIIQCGLVCASLVAVLLFVYLGGTINDFLFYIAISKSACFVAGVYAVWYFSHAKS